MVPLLGIFFLYVKNLSISFMKNTYRADTCLMKKLKVQILFLLVAILNFGCVGTVEEAGINNTEFGVGDKTLIEYTGIVRANPIAQDKIEIEFQEIFSSTTHEYFLHVNEDTPFKLSLESIIAGQIGYKKYTLKNLIPNSFYKLRVSVAEINGVGSTGENQVVVKTFDNKVSDFSGIVNVASVTGRSHNSARISWIATEMGGTYESGPFDTSYYEVTYMKTSSALAFINTDFTPDRQVLKVAASPGDNPSFVDIKTLEPETAYYFQVRAIHKLYKDEEDANESVGTPITLNKDSNTSWIQFSTTSADGIYDFDKESIVVKNAPGPAALNSVQVFWNPPVGIFEGYKVFYREYTAADGTDVNLDDELTNDAMQGYLDTANNSFYESVDVDKTSVVIAGLTKYKTYQIKIVPCKTVICKIDPDNESDSSIPSAMRAIRVEPILAPFFGINFIQPPNDSDNVDKIKLIFDSPVLSEGYANKLEVYCLDYTQANSVLLTNSPVTSAVGNCNNLIYEGIINLATTSELTISSVKNINQSPVSEASYCFAITPAVEGTGLETLKLPRVNWIVRCIQPEIKTPTVAQFAGFQGECNVNQDKATLTWSTPSGGIFNSFRIMGLKKTLSSDNFNFYNSITNLGSVDPNYINQYKAAGDTTHTFEDLEPGATYLLGILSTVDGGTPNSVNDDVYSEYNLNTVECKIPYPIATFDEWTRVLAIGAKVNGKVPVTNGGTTISSEAYIFEAINSEGIPYEVSTTGSFAAGIFVSSPGNYVLSPGNLGGSIPSSFGDAFDGRPDSGLAASRNGIISIAWKNVALDFAGTSFITNHDHAARGSRVYGYRVYRSEDNRENWEDVTDGSGLIHSGDYDYYIRSNSTVTTEKMNFFTDYSVANLITNSSGVDKARVYWYKVVPVFNEKELLFNDETSISSHNEIKITLPPPNMALIHRSMANRSLCSELGKTLEKDSSYRCDYNGLGARPKSLPWKIGETAYDFGSDLLLDRAELGCNFTRGSDTATPKYGNSFYNRGDTNQTVGIRSELVDFKGYSTNISDNDNLPFRGCTQSVSYDQDISSLHSMVATANGADFDSDLLGVGYDQKQYNSLIYGDCIMSNATTLTRSKCVNPLKRNTKGTYTYPGLPSMNAYNGSLSKYPEADCSVFDNDSPQFFNGNNSTELGLLDESFIDNVTMQAENLAVVYNRNNSRASIISPYGPSGSKILTADNPNNWFVQSCFINIAAIGAKPASGNAKWKSRWVPGNMLYKLNSPENAESYINKTVSELKSNTDVYSSGDATEYRVPTSSLDNLNRFSGSTKIGRVLSSNSSKLPPLVGFSRVEASRLCSTYEVEVGFEADSSYTRLSLPKSKRLIRKSEFIVAAAHPESRVENILGNTVDPTILNIETGVIDGSCVSNNTSAAYMILDYFNSNNRSLDGTKGMTQTTQSPLWSGSSSQDRVGARNSEKCTSRYGVQDLIGNVQDISSETLSCDFTLDAVYFGVRNVISQSILIDGYKDPVNRTGYTRLYSRGSNTSIDRTATITLQGPDALDPSDDIVLGDDETIEIWTDASPLSGYCSLVDSNGARIIDDRNFTAASGSFNPVINFNGTTNTNTVPIPNPVDQESIDFLRNGDGRFINSGPVNLLPKIADFKDSLALTSRGIAGFDSNNQMTGDYFSPVTGLPLLCDSTDISTCGADASDNTLITTTFLKNPAVTGYSIDDFPIGNSQITHSSLGTTSSVVRNVSSVEAALDSVSIIIKNIDVNSIDLTDINTKDVVGIDEEAPSVSGNAYIAGRTEFDIARFSQLNFLNGGSFNTDISGRYGMRLGIETPGTSDWNTGNNDIGIRCGVRINE